MASKRRIRRNACLGKVSHATEIFAFFAIKHSKFTATGMRTYHCQYCGKWHVGHESSKRKSARFRATEARNTL